MFQAPPSPPPTLSDIVVTAARLPPAAADAAFSVVRLDQKALERSSRLDEALRTVPAVSLFRRTSSLAANPTTQGLSLRAIAPSGAGRALVTLDGVPLNDPFGGWVIWSQVAPESLERVDIVRGAGAGSYGAGALTGTVVLTERARGGVIDASVAQDGGARLAGSASTHAGPVGVTLSGLYETSDGYTPVRGAAVGAADMPLDLDSRSVALRVDAPLGGVQDARLSLRAAAWQEDRGSGLAGARANASGHSLSATAARAPGDGYGWRLQAWRIESDLANSSVSVAADRSTTTPANDQFKTPATGSGANLALRRRVANWLGGRLEWEVGADARVNRGETRERYAYVGGAFSRERRAGGETSVAGAYVDGSWTAGEWLVAGGVRLDRWANSDGFRVERLIAGGAPTADATFDNRSGKVSSGRLAARRRLGETMSARAALYSGFRPATLNELYRPFRVGNDQTTANADLKPERLSGVEVGLASEGMRTTWNATVFWNRIDDAIVNVTLSEGASGVIRQRQNAGRISAWGVELNGAAPLTPVLSLTGALSWTDAEVDGGTAAPQLTGLRPAQAPRWSATAGLEWRATKRLTLSMAARYESARFDDDLNSRMLDAALTADTRVEWNLNDRAVLWAAADNLFDAEVQTARTADDVAGYGPPRRISLGLRLTY